MGGDFEEHVYESPKQGKFLIRHALVSDVDRLSAIMAAVYFDSPLTTFLYPQRHQYPQDLLRTWQRMIRSRLFDSRWVSLVAVPLDNTASPCPVAYLQFQRYGNDTAARQFVSSRCSLWNLTRSWYYSFQTQLEDYFWPDHAGDPIAISQHKESCEIDEFKFWGESEMAVRYGERWDVSRIVVLPEYQRRRLGKHLMELVINRAEEEKVAVSLAASVDGEQLYLHMGFEVRGRYSMTFGDDRHYAIMIWRPEELR
jgi:ribosomal protein S18 acetylase RimI-like enzyme